MAKKRAGKKVAEPVEMKVWDFEALLLEEIALGASKARKFLPGFEEFGQLQINKAVIDVIISELRDPGFELFTISQNERGSNLYDAAKDRLSGRVITDKDGNTRLAKKGRCRR